MTQREIMNAYWNNQEVWSFGKKYHIVDYFFDSRNDGFDCVKLEGETEFIWVYNIESITLENTPFEEYKSKDH